MTSGAHASTDERDQADSEESSTDAFGGEDVLAFEKARRVHEFLSQETRHHIIQAILGHPAHLLSMDEFEYVVPKNRSTIHSHLKQLAERQIVEKYVHEPNRSERPLPAEFWGLTEYGVTLLYEYKYLRSVPIMRSLYDHLYKPDKIQRHEAAPRPVLPEAVSEALAFPDANEDEILEETSSLFDAQPSDADATAETSAETDRPIDELFK